MSPRESTQLPWPGPRQSKRASTFTEASRTLTRAEESSTLPSLTYRTPSLSTEMSMGRWMSFQMVMKLAIQGEELHPVILPVTEEDLVVMDQEAVGKVEVPRLTLPWLSPGLLELTVPAEPVDAGLVRWFT